ncbi:MAG: polysaccharide biosynthesis/export family protein [Bacteroidota bacterium]
MKFKTGYTVYFLFMIIFLISSCGNQKKVIYFQNKSSFVKTQDSIPNFKSTYYSPVYQINDLLSITVSASDQELAKPFNLQNIGRENKNDNVELGYTIDFEGNIDFPVIGKIQLAGLNREEAVKLLKEKLNAYVPQTTVNIQIINFKITVLGDVRKPGTFNIQDDRVSLLEAIGYAEDLNISAVRNNILIIRENKGKKVEIRIDLNSNEFLNSSYYYLNQNDVVYVQPNRIKANSEIFNRNTGTFISIGSLLLTSLILILNR